MNQQETRSQSIRRKGIFILPNLFTTGSLFSGFFAIISSMNGHFSSAVVAIFVCLLLDGMDGRVARLINAQSPFGEEYDSLSDVIAFGIAPALIAYNWTLPILQQYGLTKLGWLTAFMYVACTALRLARFNSHATEKGCFVGLACPAAAMMAVSTLWLTQVFNLRGNLISAVVLAILLIVLALLQVSNIKYRSYKDIDLKSSVGFVYLIIFVVLLVLVAIKPPYMLFLIFATYTLSGPVRALFKRNKKDKKANGE